MKEMELNKKYAPPKDYNEAQQNDPTFFNYQYQKYQQQINNDPVHTDYNAYSAQKSTISSATDREDDNMSK